MDRFYPSHSLHLGSVPFGREVVGIAKQTATPPASVTDGVRLDLPHQGDPCPAIENWTSSSSTSPGELMPLSHQHHQHQHQHHQHHPHPHPHPPPWTMTLHSMPERGLPRLLPSRVDPPGWPSSLVTPGSSRSRPLKPGLRRLSDSRTRGLQRELESSIHHASSGMVRSGTSGAACPTTGLPSPPPVIWTSSYPSRKLDKSESPSDGDLPYSCLIEKALQQAPDNKLALQDIYGWFEKNTAKGKDRSSKGWQNSVRHNLSMNAGFEAVREESTPGKKAVNYWRLTDEALKYGVQSTTRYRKQASYKKVLGSDPPAPQRQRSGAKGGKATKIKTRLRGRSEKDELRKERFCQRVTSQRRPLKNIYAQYTTTTAATGMAAAVSPFQVSGPTTPGARPSVEPFDLGTVVGCGGLAPTPIFCDMAGPTPDSLSMDTGFLGWTAIHSFPTGFLAGPSISADLQMGA
ncbi:hypothetical protein BO71DRAFT_422565 [Aspergillus ellipticus CBS 707.79]|uniref:Forkhead box protein O n=1 Tax=Aspergillus ellipticus CBS 707.79 TaxID=1448320 RepID=A0A319DG84_9EURO|nr:hypothetical protein BO71DRAFT_422565 [Aspergillus ellipticus CBS 707.79]